MGFNPFQITNDQVRDSVLASYRQAWQEQLAIERGGVQSRKAILLGVLAKQKLEKNERTFIETVLYGADGKAESIWGGEVAFHRTQPRGGSFTVVYKREENNDIQVIGLGRHVGNDNKKYKIRFSNGKELVCERK